MRPKVDIGSNLTVLFFIIWENKQVKFFLMMNVTCFSKKIQFIFLKFFDSYLGFKGCLLEMFDDNYVKSLVAFLYFLKQPPKLFCKKGFLKDFTIMTVKRLCWVSF